MNYIHISGIRSLQPIHLKQFFVLCILMVCFVRTVAQTPAESKKDSVAKEPAKKDSSGFDRFNAKAERLFKILPVPIYLSFIGL